MFLCSAQNLMFKYTPKPVALSRPSNPPDPTGFPVTTCWFLERSDGDLVDMYVSAIQAIVCELVLTSGAGISCSGPMFSPKAYVKRLVIRSNSESEYLFGSIWIPPLAPP